VALRGQYSLLHGFLHLPVPDNLDFGISSGPSDLKDLSDDTFFDDDQIFIEDLLSDFNFESSNNLEHGKVFTTPSDLDEFVESSIYFDISRAISIITPPSNLHTNLLKASDCLNLFHNTTHTQLVSYTR
jgi:hypothetical protein